jgi:hypothetical protein
MIIKTHSFARLSVLLVALLLCLGACKKKDEAPVAVFRTLSQDKTYNGQRNYITYVYDEEGRIKNILGSILYSDLTYTGDSAYYVEYQIGGMPNNSYSMKLDAAGRFLSDDKEAYEYNSSGNLVKRTFTNLANAHTVYTWEDGNNTRTDTYINDTLYSSSVYTFYTDKLNKAHWDYNGSGIGCFFGGASKNLIKESHSLTPSGDIYEPIDWTYEFDKNDLPIHLMMLRHSNGTFIDTRYSYGRVE